jgi:hypothetical protein
LADNLLYYGDNLDVLLRHVDDESVDLVYLDPPFKSNQDYDVLFREQDGSRAAAQIQAFEDTWESDQGAAAPIRSRLKQAARSLRRCRSFGCSSARMTCWPISR